MKKTCKLLSPLLIGSFFFSLVSCGSDSGSSPAKTTTRQEQQQDDQGFYRAVLKPLNMELAGETTGTIEVRIEGDDFIVESNVIGAPSGVKHLQNIMTASTCPDMSSDTNNDNFLDFKEAMPLAGQVLIPLDSNLSEQLGGIDYGPIANGSGSYVYKRSTSLTNILADLRSPDPDPVDVIAKLSLGDNLNLSGKVILVHGTKKNPAMADTVASMRDLSPELSLPIACGRLVRVSSEETLPEETEPSEDTPIEEGEDETASTDSES